MVRPDRPHPDESLLLHEIDELSYDQGQAVEALVQYADDLEDYVDCLLSEVADSEKRLEAMSHAMGQAEREELARKHAEETRQYQVAAQDYQQHIANLSQELAMAQTKLLAVQLLLR